MDTVRHGKQGICKDGGLSEHTVTSPTAVNAVLPSTIIPPPSYLSVAGLCALFLARVGSV